MGAKFTCAHVSRISRLFAKVFSAKFEGVTPLQGRWKQLKSGPAPNKEAAQQPSVSRAA